MIGVPPIPLNVGELELIQSIPKKYHSRDRPENCNVDCVARTTSCLTDNASAEISKTPVALPFNRRPRPIAKGPSSINFLKASRRIF